MSLIHRLAGGIVFLLREAIGSIVGNLGLALMSLIMALSLWLFVTDRENPREAQAFNNPISVELVNVPEGLAVANLSEAGVRIRIEAPRNELDGLRAEEFKATVDLSGMSTGTRSVAVDVTPPNSRISVVQVTPSRVDVTIEPRRSREVPVKISPIGSAEIGFDLVSEQVDPERVTVTGPESLVELVDAAVAVVNLTGQRVSLSQRVQLEPRDANDGGISRVAVEPESATVTIELERRDYSLQFPVDPTLVGAPASGFDVGAVRVDPRIVTVTAPLEVLQSIDTSGIGTTEISLADARDDVIRTVELNLPDGASVIGGNSVRVSIDIVPQQGAFTFQVAARARNVGSGLAVTFSGPVSVTLSGDLSVLDQLNPADIEASVDVKDLEPGLHVLAVSISPPPGTTIVRIEPPELGIAITLAP